jgi:uncharacterized protein YlaN (UPF0358 family)
MTKKKTTEVNKILNLTKEQAKQILEMLESLRSINAMTDDKCPIEYEQICKLDGMEHQLANIVDATVECEHGHYSRWGGAYEYK